RVYSAGARLLRRAAKATISARAETTLDPAPPPPAPHPPSPGDSRPLASPSAPAGSASASRDASAAAPPSSSTARPPSHCDGPSSAPTVDEKLLAQAAVGDDVGQLSAPRTHDK